MSKAEKVFGYFVGEVQSLASIYRTLRELYFDDQDQTVPLLNKVAPAFFLEVFEVYRMALYLGIARLGDPPTQRNFINLSIKRVVDLIEEEKGPNPALAELGRKLDLENFPEIKTLRGKRIGHLNEEVVLQKNEFLLPDWKDIREYFLLLAEFVDVARTSLGLKKPWSIFMPGRHRHVPQLLRVLQLLEKDIPDEWVLTQEIFGQSFGNFDL